MKFNKIYKKSLTTLLVATNFVLLPSLLSGCTIKDDYSVDVNDNTIGHDDISSFMNPMLGSEDFVVLDIGDHDSIGVGYQDRKLSYCNDLDIALGIIISSDAEDESSIYDDVEYVKGILSQYDVDFPVYLDIDNIIMNDNLNNEMKTKLIKNFVEKCSSNGIYVGIKGSDTNLCRVKQYCGITDYEAYLVMDSESIRYDGVCNIVKDLDGNISSKINFAEIIASRDFNNIDNFISDAAYRVKEGDDVQDVALIASMSVNELLKFNGISKQDILPGKILRIPSSVNVNNILLTKNDNLDINVTYKAVDTPLRGADLSYAQGENSNWDLLRDNFDFIIVKCSQGKTLDDYFVDNMKNCNLHNIPVGVYCYNDYDNTNCANIQKFSLKQEAQADFVLKNIKNKKIDYPVYLDIEPQNGIDMREMLTPDQVNIMLDNWFNKMITSGYIPGIYCNQSVLSYLKECVNYSLADKFELWVAGGPQYTAGKTDIPLDEVRYPEKMAKKLFDVSVFQATDSAIGGGAEDHAGHLDINYSNVDYTDRIYENTTFEIKTFDRVDYIELVTKIGLCLFAGSVIGVAGLFYLLKQIKEHPIRTLGISGALILFYKIIKNKNKEKREKMANKEI